MHLIKWDYGSLGPEQEKEFVQRRLEMLGIGSCDYDREVMTDLITEAQKMIREFATEHIMARLIQHQFSLTSTDRIPRDELNRNAEARSRSVVSLRDIQRVFLLLDFFSTLDGVVAGCDDEKSRRSLLLTVAVVYYLRLSPDYRTRFVDKISQIPSEKEAPLTLLPVLSEAMDFVLDKSDIPHGIARTTGMRHELDVSGDWFHDVFGDCSHLRIASL